MSKITIPSIPQILLFLIPLNIYIIGDWMGSGIQTLFFRYLQTNMGNSFIPLTGEMALIFKGLLTGMSAVASVVWCLGVVLICIATGMIVYANIRNDAKFIRYCAYLNAGGAILFGIAIIIQYGIMLNGPAGFAIPLGIPVILGVAYFQYQYTMKELADDRDDKDGVDSTGNPVHDEEQPT